ERSLASQVGEIGFRELGGIAAHRAQPGDVEKVHLASNVLNHEPMPFRGEGSACRTGAKNAKTAWHPLSIPQLTRRIVVDDREGCSIATEAQAPIGNVSRKHHNPTAVGP